MNLKKILFFIIFLINGLSLKSQTIESKTDKFYGEFLKRLKEVKSEPIDEKAVTLMKKMKTDLLPEAINLQQDLDSYLTTLTEEQMIAWEEKVKEKPYNKEILELTLDSTFIEKVNKNTDFEFAYFDLIDLSDKVLQIEFAEPVDPMTECRITLNGGAFVNETFILSSSRLKDAVALTEEGNMTINIEGYSKTTLLGLTFVTEGDLPGSYIWKEDYNLTLTLIDEKSEKVLAGNEGSGKIIIETVEPFGGWVIGTFSGKLINGEGSKTPVKVEGKFKVRRMMQME